MSRSVAHQLNRAGAQQLSRRTASPLEHYEAGYTAGISWGRALAAGRSSAPSSWPAGRAALRQWLSGFSAGVACSASGQDDAEGGAP
jgi:hypothetical protein